jgi:hypothetical protein
MIAGVVAELIPEELPLAKFKPSHKQRLTNTFGRLRDAIRSKRPLEEIERRLGELEALLKLACTISSHGLRAFGYVERNFELFRVIRI